MAGINQGRPELAVGEPIRLGSNNEFEIEQHPVSDRLIIRDTVNGKVAYVRKERGGQIGGDGVLIKALKESKPMADDGRVYDTVQQAERAAGSWVFVPPGTYDENVVINTQGLTLRGSGYNTHIASSNGSASVVEVYSDNVSIDSIRLSHTVSSSGRGVGGNANNTTIANVDISGVNRGIRLGGNSSVINCSIDNIDTAAVDPYEVNSIIVSNNIGPNISSIGINSSNSGIISNNIITGTGNHGILSRSDNIVTGNRIINSSAYGINISGSDNIIANNRVSDSTDGDINDTGVNNLLDGNVTGASN